LGAILRNCSLRTHKLPDLHYADVCEAAVCSCSASRASTVFRSISFLEWMHDIVKKRETEKNAEISLKIYARPENHCFMMILETIELFSVFTRKNSAEKAKQKEVEATQMVMELNEWINV
jgi:hypothetical protein